MKKLIALVSLTTLFVAFSANINVVKSMHSPNVNDTIHIWASPELYEIATSWVNAYEKINPEALINVSNISANRVPYMIDSPGNIGLITKKNIPVLSNKLNWKIEVGRDVIVPVMNSENPFSEEIFKKGISPEEFASVFTENENPIWETLLNNNHSNSVNCYFVNNETTKPYLVEFLKTDPDKLKGKDILSTDEMLEKVSKDKYSIGFCRLVDVLDTESKELKESLSFIPIDLNGNDRVDFVEDIYNTSGTLERGVWIGKYPKALYSNIYSLTSNQPVKSGELEFLEWIITEGQQYLIASGYSELILSERQRKVESLYDHQIQIADVQPKVYAEPSVLAMVLIIAGIILLMIVIGYIKSRNPEIEEEQIIIPKVFSESSVIVPNGLFFDKSHTWAFMEMDGNVRIGIADFLQHVTGQITNVKMKNQGEFVKKGEPFLTLIQQGKQLNIQSPVSGRIKEINTQLNTNSSMINTSPYFEGWVYVIESVSWLKEIKTYLMGETYKAWLNGEFLRLKHFFSSFIQLNVTNQLQQVIQDGGELYAGLLESFGPVIWEEFQSRFINREK